MYKLFLCLTYLRRRVMAYFAMLAVALCVMMLLIATSVFDGFLRQIEVAAKGLFGDIVIDAPGQSGLKYYDAFIAEVTKLEEVEAATPFITTYGILSIRGTAHSQAVQIAGVRLPERAAATSFEEGLFVQGGSAAPTFDPPVAEVIARLISESEADAKMFVREEKRMRELGEELAEASGRAQRVLAARVEAKRALLRQLNHAASRREDAVARLRRAQAYQGPLAKLQRQIDEIVPPGADEQSLSPALSDKLNDLRERLHGLEDESGLRGPRNRVILGLGLPSLHRRTESRETIRVVGPGDRIVLSIFPVGRRVTTDMVPTDAAFTVIDDSKSGVLLFDSNTVYVPFEELQRLSAMGAEVSADNPSEVVNPARCGQIHIKLVEKYSEGQALAVTRDRVDKAWRDFCKTHPRAGGQDVTVHTWREQQAQIIGPVESQRTLVVIMFSLMSLVSVVLIFVIFYTIVVQHTRDIGVIKSLGGSGIGVAGIFLGYGSILGAIGAVLGVVGGTYFVHYVNEIHDWVGETFGFRVWSAEAFMFDSIPNTIETSTMVIIALWAVVGGLIGALVPAIRAARMQPVEALRYE